MRLVKNKPFQQLSHISTSERSFLSRNWGGEANTKIFYQSPNFIATFEGALFWEVYGIQTSLDGPVFGYRLF